MSFTVGKDFQHTADCRYVIRDEYGEVVGPRYATFSEASNAIRVIEEFLSVGYQIVKVAF